MAHRRADLERLLAYSGGALRRLAWLLTGEPESASTLLRDALVEAYLAPGGQTDDERAGGVRHALLKVFVRGDAPVGAAQFGAATDLPRRDWAAGVLSHTSGLPDRQIAKLADLSRADVAAAADRAAPLLDGLGSAEPPPTVGRPVADEVIAAAEPVITRRRLTRRRRVTALVLVSVLALGGIGLLASLQDVDGQTSSVRVDRSADVEVSSGRTERLRVRMSGVALRLSFYGKPATWASATVQAPARSGEVVAGEIRGMRFYLVQDTVEQARVAFGRTIGAVGERSVTVISAGVWTVLWPPQGGLAVRGLEPVGMLWRTTTGAERAYVPPGVDRALHRMIVSTGGGGRPAALALGDDTALLLMTWDGMRQQPVRQGRAVLAGVSDGAPLPYTAAGYGRVTRASTPARAVPEIDRGPASSPLYTVSVPEAAHSGLADRIPVTLYDGDRVVGHLTLRRGG